MLLCAISPVGGQPPIGGGPDDSADQPEVLTDTGVPADGCDQPTEATDDCIRTNVDEAEAADCEDQRPTVQFRSLEELVQDYKDRGGASLQPCGRPDGIRGYYLRETLAKLALGMNELNCRMGASWGHDQQKVGHEIKSIKRQNTPAPQKTATTKTQSHHQ